MLSKHSMTKHPSINARFSLILAAILGLFHVKLNVPVKPCKNLARHRVCFFMDHREPLYLCDIHVAVVGRHDNLRETGHAQWETADEPCQFHKYHPLKGAR